MKFMALLMALVMALGLGCALAESNALPAYVYPGEDPVWTAVVKYMQETDFGYAPEEDGVLIPTPIIVKTDISANENEASVYGNFWIFCYRQNGKILETTSCGEMPGIMKLEKKDGVWTVTDAEFAGDGDAYATDIARFANGDKALEKEYSLTTGASEDSILPQFQRAAVAEYVAANKLDIEGLRNAGADPVPVND